MKITYQKEFFVQLIPELPELFMGEYEEAVEDKNRHKLNPAWQRYVELEMAQILHILTVRADGKLVGYIFNFIYPALQFADLVCASSDIMFILPAYRRGFTGVKLFIENDKMLKKLGAKKVLATFPSHANMQQLMKRLKYEVSGSIFSKWL